jgi:hypothetical protein
MSAVLYDHRSAIVWASLGTAVAAVLAWVT